MSDLTAFLAAGETVDADHPTVVDFARRSAGTGAVRAQAVALYYAVRDGFRYDPYAIDLSVAGLRASTVLAKGHGWCVTKAALLAAACRAQGIPARLGFADVRNHLSTARLRETLKTDVFYWHGYTAILIDGQWVKATPAFNIELTERFRLKPLDFDGRADSIYHPFDLDGRAHMEYLRFRGEFAEIPVTEMRDDFARLYPAMALVGSADFDADIRAETDGIPLR
jgi:transglutaminase-like putative cysteine protease